jgi:hypothetical protein
MVYPPATSEVGARRPAIISWSTLRKHNQNQHNRKVDIKDNQLGIKLIPMISTWDQVDPIFPVRVFSSCWLADMALPGCCGFLEKILKMPSGPIWLSYSRDTILNISRAIAAIRKVCFCSMGKPTAEQKVESLAALGDFIHINLGAAAVVLLGPTKMWILAPNSPFL